jgi:hypothetical protein
MAFLETVRRKGFRSLFDASMALARCSSLSRTLQKIHALARRVAAGGS